jgi:hypothetical protein
MPTAEAIIDRWMLVFSGIFTGFAINAMLTYFSITSTSFLRIISAIVAIFGMSFTFWIFVTEKRLKTIRKARLFFFGFSIASFGLAILDVVITILQKANVFLYNGFPYITIGSISFGSILISFALGGFFSVVERFLDLHEKGDI